MIMVRRRLTGVAAAAALLAGGGLAGCGSSSSTTESSTISTPSDSPQTDQPGQGGDQAQMEAIRTCLEKAGIATPDPSGTSGTVGGPPPAGAPSGAPSGAPTGAPDAQAGGPGAPGAPGDPFSDPTVAAALKACGITAPASPPGAEEAPTGGSPATG